MNHTTRNPKKTALLLTVLLLISALGSLMWILIDLSDSTGSGELVADIYQNGELIQSIPLDTVTESYTFTVTGENNCHNEIEVRPGSIGILSADCPDKLCVNQGFIRSSLLPITCLPNKLVIQVRTEATTEDNSPDIITY